MLNKQEQSQIDKSKLQTSQMMQKTAQFFHSIPKTQLNNFEETNECKQEEIEQNEFIDLPQPLQVLKADRDELYQISKADKNSYKKKKKNTNSFNQREISQSTKCLTSDDQSLILIQNERKSDELIQNQFQREASAPVQYSGSSQKNMLQQRQKSDKLNQNNYTQSNERLKPLNQNERSIVNEVKKRGLSLVCDNYQNEEIDQQFWNKINQIVCINKDQDMQALNQPNNYSLSQFYPISANSSQKQIQIPLISHKTEKSSTLASKKYSERNYSYQDIIMQQQKYKTNKSSPQKQVQTIGIQATQQFLSPYRSLKNFNLQGSLPILNGVIHQQNQDYQQQQQRVFFTNTSQEINMKQSQLNCIERNFWSSQMGMRQDISNSNNLDQENNLNSNKLQSNHFKLQSINLSKENFQNTLSTSPQQRIQNLQHSQMAIHPNYQPFKNRVQSKGIISSPSDSKIFLQNQVQKTLFQSENLVKKSNNFINEVPSLQANREAKLSQLTNQQIEGIDKYYNDPQKQHPKVRKSQQYSPLLASSSMKDFSMHQQAQVLFLIS